MSKDLGRIVSSTGTVIQEDTERQSVITRFLNRHKGCRIHWGHYFRAMKRRTDPESLMWICKNKDCKWLGEELHVSKEA